MDVQNAQRLAFNTLKAAGIEEADRESRLIISYLLDCPIGALPLTDKALNAAKELHLQAILEARKKRIPLQYILGETEFMSLTFKTDPQVLIPRGDTERIVEAAIALLKNDSAPLIADICCGSGNIGISLAYYLPTAKVIAVDISPAALRLARENALTYQLEQRIDFHLGNLLEPLKRAKAHPRMIISNPPYIRSDDIGLLQPEVQNEPRLALDGGKDGLDYYRLLITGSFDILPPLGYLVMETGYDQKDWVIDILKENHYSVLSAVNDYGGNHRGIVAQKP